MAIFKFKINIQNTIRSGQYNASNLKEVKEILFNKYQNCKIIEIKKLDWMFKLNLLEAPWKMYFVDISAPRARIYFGGSMKHTRGFSLSVGVHFGNFHRRKVPKNRLPNSAEVLYWVF